MLRGCAGRQTFRLQVRTRPQLESQSQQRLLQCIELEVFHERRQVKIPKYVLGTTLYRLGDFAGLVGVVCDFAHLANEDVVITRVGNRPIEAREYLRSIAGDKPGEIL